MRRGKSLRPFSDEDASELYHFPETQFLRINVEGSKKERSYRELCFYWSSCEYISTLGINENMNSKNKVDYLTRLKLNFVEATVFDENGLLHWIVKPLNYQRCEQPDAHKYISEALELHAGMIGLTDELDDPENTAVKKYKKLLESQ